MIWPLMASVGAQVNGAELKRDCISKLTRQLERPKPPRKSHVTTQVLPIWKLEKKNCGYNCQHVHCMVPSSYCFSEPSKKAASITPTPPRTPPKYFATLERTLVFHRPLIHQRPYSRTESPSLRSKAEDQRSYASTVRPFPKSIRSAGAMTSSLMDQFPLPSAAGELTELGIRRHTSVTLSPKLSSDASRPALIMNAFLHPTSAKVPLPPQGDNRKNKTSPHVGAKSASLHNGETVFPSSGVPTLTHNSIGTGNVSSGIQGAAKTEAATCPIHKNVTDVPYRGVQLTEAVRRLTGRCFDISPKAVYQKEEESTSCDEKSPPAFHPDLPNNTSPCSLISDSHCLNGDSGSLYSANVCTKLNGSNLIAAEMDSNNLGTSYQTTETSSITSEPQPPVTGETAQRENIIVMASQISTIHLNRACVKDVGDQPDSAASEQE